MSAVEVPKVGSSRTAWLVVAATVAVVGVVAIVLASGGGGSDQATVPQLVQLDQQGALARLEASGLDAGPVQTEASTLVVAGTVLAQDPAAGATLADGQSVNLTVAIAPEPSVVPGLTGLTENEARELLTEAGFVAIEANPVPDNTPAGTVLAQTPLADSVVSGATPVILAISSGPTSRAVPRTQGLAVAEAQTRLEVAGWNVDIRDVEHEAVAQGLVVRTDPAVGTEVNLGTLVTVFASAGPATVAVPALVGLSAIDAATAVETAGLTLNTSSCETTDQAPGSVTEQDPGVASAVAPGSTVTVCVAVPPPTPTPEATATPVPTSAPPPNNPPPPPAPTSPPDCLPTDSSCR